MTRLLLALAILSTVVPREASGQAITIDTVKKDIVQEGVMAARLNSPATPVRRPFSGTVDTSASYGSLVTLVVLQGVQKKQAYKTLVDLMAVRVDTQLGSPSQSSGSTSLATKGAVPAILGFAVEHGALTRDVNGTVVTFRASPAGLVKALQGEGLLDMYRDYEQSAGFRFASRFSLAASFDTSRGETPNSLLADEQQLSAWSVRVVAYDTRDPRGRKYYDFWTTLAHEQGAVLQDVRRRLVEAFGRWPGFTTWQSAFTSRVIAEVDGPWESSARGDAATQRAATTMTRILDEELPKLAALGTPPADVAPALDAYVSNLTQVVTFRNDVYAYALKGSIATFDWTTARDPNLPDLYTLTGVYEGSFGKQRLTDVTANAAVSFYASEVGGRSLKDFAFTAQLDKPLGSVAEIPFVLTASFKWQYLPEDVPVPASALVTSVTEDISAMPAPLPTATVMAGAAIAPKGHLVLGQAKLTIPLKGGAKIPLSVTLANRTELITEKKVIARANFGVTFDLDAFAAAVRAR
jgi:hypothetical protein